MNYFTEILIPLFCAIIGGFVTLLGVKWTIKNEKEQDRKNKKLEIKPIFYRIDPFQQYFDDNTMELFFRYNPSGLMKKEISGTFKNTDQAIMKIDYIEYDNRRYYPQNGNVVDKNVIFELRILTNKISKNRKIVLKVEDVLENVYFYKMIFRYFHGYYIINSIEEIKNIDKE